MKMSYIGAIMHAFSSVTHACSVEWLALDLFYQEEVLLRTDAP